jgi:large subunit ribosomal protein L25
MSTITLEAESRTNVGKGASRRLRRLENKIPGVLYGGGKEPKSIHLMQNKVVKALETESIYSSILNLKVDGKGEQVILKSLQRHPIRPIILHMDFQRVGASDVLVKMIPLHFANEDVCPGFKAGGVVNHSMVHVEVRCQAKHLPEFIEVDLSAMDVDDVLHLSDLKLPKNVQLAVDPKTGGHDHPVVSIHMPRAVLEEEVETESVGTTEAETAEGAESAAAEASEKPTEESAD